MSPIKLYKLPQGIYVVREDLSGYLDSEWDALFEAENIYSVLSDATLTEREADLDEALAPIGAQEVWASGVTYYSSRMAREAESAAAGGGNFYTRVYAAERPEMAAIHPPQTAIWLPTTEQPHLAVAIAEPVP